MILGICENIDVLKVINIVVIILKIIQIVVPIVLMFSLMFKMINAMTKKDDDALSSLKKKVVPNIVAAVLIFIVPLLVGIIMNVTFPDSEYTKCIVGISSEKLQQAYEEKAEKLVSKAEETLNINDYVNAMNYMPNVKDKDKRRGYEERLEAVKALIDEARKPEEPEYDPDAFPGERYDLTDEEIIYLANVCYCEQGKDDGIAAEASLMANLYELNKDNPKYDSVVTYVKTSGWFSCSTTTKKAQEHQYEIVRNVLVNGNRSMPPYINEHDCSNCNDSLCTNGNRGDICKIVVDGKTYESMNEIKNRSNYIRDNTVIYNKYGSVYTFYSFPCEGCDPFGYTASAYNRYNN